MRDRWLRNCSLLLALTHRWSVAARLMMEWSGRLERHSHEVWLTKVTMTTERSILGGDSSINWQEEGWSVRGVCVCTENSWKRLFIFYYFPFFLLCCFPYNTMSDDECFSWCVDVMAARLCNCAWLWIVLTRCPVAAKGRPTAVGRVVRLMSFLHNWVDWFLSSFLRQFEVHEDKIPTQLCNVTER